MVSEFKPRYTNALQVAFAGILRLALTDYFGIDDAICPVLYTGQPLPVTAKRCVTFSKIGSHRVGFQANALLTDDDPTTNFYDVENWIDELTFQVNARCKESAVDDETTPVARDVADGLATWFNSHRGVAYMGTSRIYPVRVSDIRNLTSADESDLFQSVASFDVTVQVPQTKTMQEIEAVTPRLKDVIGVPLR